MYERFISSSMLTGIFCVVSLMSISSSQRQDAKPQRTIRLKGILCALASWRWDSRPSNIEIPHVERVVFDEFPARLDLVAHQRGEHLIGFRVILGANLQQRPSVRIHR